MINELPTATAFPWTQGGITCMGMTLRDYFAARAMQADMSTYSEDLIYEQIEWFEARAKQWYAVADAMIKAREQE
jgi:hypothetical protein